MKALIVVTLLLFIAHCAFGSDFRKWTDNTGSFEVQARLLSIGEKAVVLEEFPDRKITVPLDRLSDLDKSFVSREQKILSYRERISQEERRYALQYERIRRQDESLDSRIKNLRKKSSSGQDRRTQETIRRLDSDRLELRKEISTLRKNSLEIILKLTQEKRKIIVETPFPGDPTYLKVEDIYAITREEYIQFYRKEAPRITRFHDTRAIIPSNWPKGWPLPGTVMGGVTGSQFNPAMPSMRELYGDAPLIINGIIISREQPKEK